jgi:flagellar FliJ protein
MKKFSFRLETLLQHRHKVEERERTKFSNIRGELLAALDHMQMLRAKHAQMLYELAQKKCGNCDSQEITLYYRFLDRLDHELEQAAKRIAEIEGRLETQKRVMIEASRDKKMIENLRNKREKEFHTALEKDEQKSIDEMVVTRYALKQ